MSKRNVLFAIIAMVLSWRRNRSIFWLLIHGYMGGWYIIYRLLFSWKNRRTEVESRYEC